MAIIDGFVAGDDDVSLLAILRKLDNGHRSIRDVGFIRRELGLLRPHYGQGPRPVNVPAARIIAASQPTIEDIDAEVEAPPIAADHAFCEAMRAAIESGKENPGKTVHVIERVPIRIYGEPTHSGMTSPAWMCARLGAPETKEMSDYGDAA